MMVSPRTELISVNYGNGYRITGCRLRAMVAKKRMGTGFVHFMQVVHQFVTSAHRDSRLLL
jgi:hypothetical protein